MRKVLKNICEYAYVKGPQNIYACPSLLSTYIFEKACLCGFREYIIKDTSRIYYIINSPYI